MTQRPTTQGATTPQVTPQRATASRPGRDRAVAAVRAVRAARARWWDDRTAALAILLVGLALIGLGVSNPSPPWLPAGVVDRAGAWHVALLVVASGALVVKRRHPVAVLAVTAACAAADAVLGGSVATIIVLFDALYTAALVTGPSARRRIVATVVVVVVGVPVATVWLGAEPREALLLLLQSAALYGTPLWWAHDVRQRDELAALEAGRAAAERSRAEAERSRAEAEGSRARAESRRADVEQRAASLARAHADDLERIAELDRESAVREERARMARDLHDVVAGHLSAAAIRAEAALAGPPDAAADRTSLRAVRAATLDALAEMRSMIVVLRGRPDAVTAPAGLDRLGALVEAAQAAGQEVEVVGSVPPALPAAVDHASFRIVQESLTNAAKHAPGAPVRVALTASDHALDVTVTNVEQHRPVEQAPPVAPPLHGGTGLLTMRERAEALGGTLDTGTADGTWTVRAHLPLVLA